MYVQKCNTEGKLTYFSLCSMCSLTINEAFSFKQKCFYVFPPNAYPGNYLMWPPPDGPGLSYLCVKELYLAKTHNCMYFKSVSLS